LCRLINYDPKKVQVYYLIYKDNTGDELARARELTEQLGFSFLTANAILMPVELLIHLVNGNRQAIPKDALDIISHLRQDPGVALDRLRSLHKGEQLLTCKLRDEQLTLDVNGDVYVCCSIYDSQWHKNIGNYLDFPLEIIQQAKLECAEICDQCIANRINYYFLNDDPELNKEPTQ